MAEGKLDAAGEGEGGEENAQTEAIEPRNTGINTYVYWVCNSPLGAWTLLPDLKPSDVINARNIKYTFSGDLNRKIYTNPFYF